MGDMRRLFFTKDNELDFGWLLLIGSFLFGIIAAAMEASKRWDLSNAAWAYLGANNAMSYIAGAAISRARLIAKSETPGNVAKAIASALDGVKGPTEYDILDVR